MAKSLSGETLQERAELRAAGLPALLVAAERVAATVAQGVHGRRRVGQGESFWQYRPYEPDDPASMIDWRQTAKADRPFVREMEWEAAQTLWIWCDPSASMDWSSTPALRTKRWRAQVLVLALCSLLLRGGERVQILGQDVQPLAGRAGMPRLARLLEEMPLLAGEKSSLPSSEGPRRYGHVLLASDFFSPLEELEKRLRLLAQKGVQGHLLQVLDPSELELPFEGRMEFLGLEGEESWLIGKVEAVRGDYKRKMELHIAGLRDIANRLGWSFSQHRSDSSPEQSILEVYAVLAGRMEGAR